MTSTTTNKFSSEVRARAVRLVQDHEGDHASRWAAISSIAAKIGCSLHTLLEWVKKAGRSRHGLPVRAIHSTASTNSLLFLPLRPGSLGLPRHKGSIFAHWASVKTNRSIWSLNHSQAPRGILNPNRP